MSKDTVRECYREIRRNCATWRATIPPPPEPFRRLVAELLAEADTGARLGTSSVQRAPLESVAKPVRRRRSPSRPPVNAPVAKPGVWLYPQPYGGRCKCCGCPHDELTPDCQNCVNRHNQRRRTLELAEAA